MCTYIYIPSYHIISLRVILCRSLPFQVCLDLNFPRKVRARGSINNSPWPGRPIRDIPIIKCARDRPEKANVARLRSQCWCLANDIVFRANLTVQLRFSFERSYLNFNVATSITNNATPWQLIDTETFLEVVVVFLQVQRLNNMGNKPASGSGGSSAAVDRKSTKLPKKSTLSKNVEIQHIVKSPKNYVDMGIVEDDETAG